MLGEVASTVNGNNDDVVLVLHEGQVRSFPKSLTIEAMKVDDLEIVDKEEREDLHLDFFFIIFFLFSSPSDLQAQAPPHQSLSASSPS